MHVMSIGRALVLALLPVVLFACVFDDDSRRHAHEPRGSDVAAPSGGTTQSPSGASTAPMLVEVDTDQTMIATPGEGVGVFVEYGAGGKWRVWWTCDTAKTRQSCDFSVSVTAASGTISNLDSSELASGSTTTPTPSRVEAKTTTSSEVHGLFFTTKPGTVITVDAALGTLKDGSFLFFVQDGKVNGGYPGRLTNPLQMQGKTP